MKDEQARDSILTLSERINRLDDIYWLPRSAIRNCPRCAHPVLAILNSPDNVYQCLTCGSKFTYERTEQLVNKPRDEKDD